MASGLSQAPDRSPEPRPDMARSRDALERVARTLGVPVLARHSALGDATTVALCWLALQQPRPGSRQAPARGQRP